MGQPLEVTITFSATPAFWSNDWATSWAKRVCASAARRFSTDMEDLFIDHYYDSTTGLLGHYVTLEAAVKAALSTDVLMKQNDQLAVTDPSDTLFGFHVDLPDDPFIGLGMYTHGFVQANLYRAILAACKIKGVYMLWPFYIQHQTMQTMPSGVMYGGGVEPPVLRRY